MMKKVILGLTEKVLVMGTNEKKEEVTARIDTGATGSSLDEKLAQRLDLAPGTKTKVIKSASGVKQRPVVKARIKLDDKVIEEEFTLADRSHMTYPLLIGQNILKKSNFLIDPQKKVQK